MTTIQPVTRPAERLVSVSPFTARGESHCHDCSIVFTRGDQVRETVREGQPRNSIPVFLHETCWEQRARGVFYPADILTYDDTREFVTEYNDRLCIVVQIAVCQKPDTAEKRLGRATYYLTSSSGSDPLFDLRDIEVIYTHIDTPATDDAARQHLQALDPAEFTWDGTTQHHDSVDPWIATYWPATITRRHRDGLDDDY